MTRIEFYFNVSNKHEVIENLVQLALIKRRQVTVLSSDEQAAASVSEGLWQNKPTSFLPNIQIGRANLIQKSFNQAALTPVVIGWQTAELTQDDILINLTTSEPIFFSRFTQLVEIIGLDDHDKSAGRLRYKFYRDRGYEIKNIDYATSNKGNVF